LSVNRKNADWEELFSIGEVFFLLTRPLMGDPDILSENSVEYSLPSPENYYLVGHAVPMGETWETGDLQGGFNIIVEE